MSEFEYFENDERTIFVKKLTVLLAIVVVLLVALSLYARLAPSDPVRWHVLPEGLETGDRAGAAVRVIPAEDGTLAGLDALIRATPRTTVLAGSVDEGMITYTTRSALFGFPDYTTVAQQGDQITLYGRLRLGKSDMGVNAKRLDGWLGQL